MPDSALHRSLLSLLFASLASCVSASIEANQGQYEVAGGTSLTLESNGQGLNLPNSSLAEYGVTREEGAASVRGTVSLGMPTLRISAIQTEYSGARDLTGLQIGDDLVTEGDLATALELDLYEATLLFELIPGDTIDLAIGLGAERMSVDLDVKGEDIDVENVGLVNLSDRLNEDLTIPVIGILGAVRLGPSRLAANINWLELEIDDSEVGYLDLDLQASVGLWGPLTAALGYRKVKLDAVFDDGNETGTVDLTLDGPYFGLRASF